MRPEQEAPDDDDVEGHARPVPHSDQNIKDEIQPVGWDEDEPAKD